MEALWEAAGVERRLREALDDPEVQAGLEPEIGFARAMHELGAMSALLSVADDGDHDPKRLSGEAADLCLVIFKAVAALATTMLGPRVLQDELEKLLDEHSEFGPTEFSGATISNLVRTLEGVGVLLIRGVTDPYVSPHDVLLDAAASSGAVFTRLSRAADGRAG